MIRLHGLLNLTSIKDDLVTDGSALSVDISSKKIFLYRHGITYGKQD